LNCFELHNSYTVQFSRIGVTIRRLLYLIIWCYICQQIFH
jgi:hypothetical protein